METSHCRAVVTIAARHKTLILDVPIAHDEQLRPFDPKEHLGAYMRKIPTTMGGGEDED